MTVTDVAVAEPQHAPQVVHGRRVVEHRRGDVGDEHVGRRAAQGLVHRGAYENADLIRENRPLSGGFDRLAALLGELAQQRRFLVVELGRHLDDELRAQVAAAAALQPGHAAAAQHELPAGLRAGGNDELLVAVERRQLDRRAERGLGDRDRHVGDEVVAVAPVALVRRRPGGGRTGRRRRRRAARPRRGPVSRSVEPVSTPAGTSTWYVCSTVTRPSPRHVGHGVTMTWPSPPQRGHGPDVTIWPSRLWRTRCTCPEPLQSAHVTGCVPCAGAGAAAVVAALRQPQRDRHRGAEHGLLERDVGDDLHVLAARRTGRAATRRRRRTGSAAAEEGVEQVVEPATGEDVVDRRAADAAPPTPASPKRS